MARTSPATDPKASGAAMDRNDLVAGWVAQISQIDLSGSALAPAGRVLDALAAISDTGIVEGLRLLRARAREADGSSIGMRRGVAIDRLGDAERAGLRSIEDAALRIELACWQTDGAEYGVIERLGRLDVVSAD